MKYGLNNCFSKALLWAVLSFIPLLSFSQTAEQITGKWKGAIEIPGTKLELSITLEQKDGAWSGAMDIPVQKVSNMELADLVITGDSISFTLPEVPGNAAFRGRFEDNTSWVRGMFSQMKQSFPMALQKESAAQKAAEEARLAQALAEIRHLADSLRLLQKVPGLGLGIIMDGEVLMAEGFGFASREEQIPIGAQTLFAIGSCSKAFTATGLAMLVEEGKLEWDKPVIGYMPDFKLKDEFATREMTTIDLLTHQSGLPRHDLMWYGSSFSREELYERLRYLEPNKSFRSAWQYQNLMYMTAGLLAERLSGQSWEELTRERIFQPLGMKNSCYSAREALPGVPVAYPYLKQDEEVKRIPYRDIPAVAPAGAIYSNVEDMLKWASFQLSKGEAGGQQLLKAETLAKLHQPHKVIEGGAPAKSPEISSRSYALGWFVYRYDGLDIVQHGGNIDGFSALVFLAPGQQIGIVALTNLNGTPLPAILAHSATDLLLGRDRIDWYSRAYGLGDNKEEEEKKEEPQPVANTVPSHPLKDYTGRYEHPAYGIMEVKLDGEALRLQYNAFELPLKHWHYDVFQGRIEEFGQDILFSFYSNKDGLADRLSAPLEPAIPEDISFTKLPPDLLADKGYIAKLTGAYDLNGLTVTVDWLGDKLMATVPGQPPYELQPYKENWFRLKGLNGYSAEFTLEKEKEKATQLKFHQPNGIFTAQRKE
ncbi:MAG: serine hydrolase [Lewinellaceae bacterium]|nr:serine hydrolase [Lewinellaceae bacterium]